MGFYWPAAMKTGHQFKGGVNEWMNEWMNEYMNILYLKMLLFPMSFFLWRVEYALEGLVLTEKMWLLPLVSYWGGWDAHIDFLRLFFLVRVICPLMQEHSLWLKKLISQAPEDAMFKIMPCSQKSNVNQTCQQSVFSPKGACFRVWCTAGSMERRSQMFVYRLSPFSFPVLAIFSS